MDNTASPKANLAEKVIVRMELAERIENQLDQVVETLQEYLQNNSTMEAKHNVFGFLCYRLQPLFPLDMPRPRKQHKNRLLPMEVELLTRLITSERPAQPA